MYDYYVGPKDCHVMSRSRLCSAYGNTITIDWRVVKISRDRWVDGQYGGGERGKETPCRCTSVRGALAILHARRQEGGLAPFRCSSSKVTYRLYRQRESRSFSPSQCSPVSLSAFRTPKPFQSICQIYRPGRHLSATPVALRNTSDSICKESKDIWTQKAQSLQNVKNIKVQYYNYSELQ